MFGGTTSTNVDKHEDSRQEDVEAFFGGF